MTKNETQQYREFGSHFHDHLFLAVQTNYAEATGTPLVEFARRDDNARKTHSVTLSREDAETLADWIYATRPYDQIEEAKADALREASTSLYLSGKGQHNEDAKNWLRRRANLIDPRTRDLVCDHGYPKSRDCAYCDGVQP